jgi:DNA-binding XRE family transcriptional regulator
VKDNSPTLRGPTLRQRELGKRLREPRNEYSLTVGDVAEDLEWSASKIIRIETGARCPSLPDVHDFCAHYRVNKPMRAKLKTSPERPRSRARGLIMRILLDPFSGSGMMLRVVEASRCTLYLCFSRLRST